MGVLMVYLDKATDLADTDMIGKSDPYVKFKLEQDNWMFDKTFGKVQSSTQKDNLNPHWGETYAFDIPSLDKMKLHITTMKGLTNQTRTRNTRTESI